MPDPFAYRLLSKAESPIRNSGVGASWHEAAASRKSAAFRIRRCGAVAEAPPRVRRRLRRGARGISMSFGLQPGLRKRGTGERLTNPFKVRVSIGNNVTIPVTVDW